MSVLGGFQAALQNPLGALQRAFGDLTKAVSFLQQQLTQLARVAGGGALAGGLSVFGDTLTLLAAQVTKGLIPVFVDLATSVLDAADTFGEFWDGVKGAGEAVVGFFDRLGGATQYAMTSIETLGMAVSDAVTWIKRKVGLGGEYYTEEDYAQQRVTARAALKQMTEGAEPGTGPSPQRLRNMESVVSALTAAFAMKGQVGFGGIAEAQKQIQLNAFQTNIQAKILEVQKEGVAIAQQHLDVARRQQQGMAR